MPSTSERAAAWLLVGGQMALLGAIARLPRRNDWPVPGPLRALAWAGQGTGLALSSAAAARLGPGLSPSPLPTAQAELRTDGLYAHVRHPIYSGVLLAATARALASGNRNALLALGFLGVVLHVKAGFEERHLTERFPEYHAYAATTPRLIPTRLGHLLDR
jgi:protein-S-isoprenylcysteine O-methyltransferase Ste14